MSTPDGCGLEAIRQIVDMAEEVSAEAPRPLTRELPPADPFPLDALGGLLGGAARAINDRVQAPPAICGQSVLAAAALATQAHAMIELPTGQQKPLSNDFVTVAQTGERKSASDYEAGVPIRTREEGLREAYDADLLNYLEGTA